MATGIIYVGVPQGSVLSPGIFEGEDIWKPNIYDLVQGVEFCCSLKEGS